MNAAADLDFWVGGQHVVIAAQNPTKFHVVVVRGQTPAMNLDALSATGPATAIDVSNPGAKVLLCQSGGQSNNVEIAEVVAAKGTASAMDLQNLQAYFKNKFRL